MTVSRSWLAGFARLCRADAQALAYDTSPHGLGAGLTPRESGARAQHLLATAAAVERRIVAERKERRT